MKSIKLLLKSAVFVLPLSMSASVCEYKLSFDKSMIDFGGISTSKNMSITLKNESIGDNCDLNLFQLYSTKQGQGVFSNSDFSGIIAQNSSIDIEVTMTPDYTDNITKYEDSDLFAHAVGVDSSGKKHYVKNWVDYRAIENCDYKLSFDKSMIDFGDVSTSKKMSVTLKNESLGNSCDLNLFQLYSTKQGQGVFSNSDFSGNLAQNSSIDIEVTMTPSYTDSTIKYEDSDLFAHAVGVDSSGKKHYVKNWVDYKAVEIDKQNVCNLEIVGNPNLKLDADYGLWLDLPLEESYIKYPLDGEKLTDFKLKFSGFYNTPNRSIGGIGLFIKYLDGSIHNAAYIADGWQNPGQGQLIVVNNDYVEGSHGTYLGYDQGPMKDFFNYQIDADLPLDKQENIDYIYIKAWDYDGYPYSLHYIKDIELTIDDKVKVLDFSCLF